MRRKAPMFWVHRSFILRREHGSRNDEAESAYALKGYRVLLLARLSHKQRRPQRSEAKAQALLLIS